MYLTLSAFLILLHLHSEYPDPGVFFCSRLKHYASLSDTLTLTVLLISPHTSAEESLKVQETGSEFTLSMDRWPCQFMLVSALPGDCVPSSQVPLDQSSILTKPWFITSSFPHSLPLELQSNSALLSFNPF